MISGSAPGAFENNRAIVILGAGAAAAGLLLGLVMDVMSIKVLIMGLFGVIGASLVLLPYHWAVAVFFNYIAIEGMLKILSGYNPVIHVGIDLLVCSLTARWFLVFLLRREELPSDRPPLLWLFGAHLAWFLIEFANPYSIGLFPSLAGAKIYVTMLLFYGYGYYLAQDVRRIHFFLGAWILGAGVLQTVFGLYQAALGPLSVLSMSSNYRSPLMIYQGLAFRPFGTGPLPGSAATLLCLCLPFMVYFVIHSKSLLTRIFLLVLMPFSVATILFCQVRVALMMTITGIFCFLLFSMAFAKAATRKRMMIGLPVGALVLAFAVPRMTTYWVDQQQDNARAVDRTLSLFDYDRIINARAGALGRIIFYAKNLPLGAGLSRGGAAAGKFREQIASNPFYNVDIFGDNLWATTIGEIGIPGSVILTLLVFSILSRGLWSLFRFKNNQYALLQCLAVSSLILIVVSFWGSESLLYNPTSAYFWFFSGVAMRLPKLDAALSATGT